jgi:hypothetical protein
MFYLIGGVSESQTLVGGGDVHGESARVGIHANLEDGNLRRNIFCSSYYFNNEKE